MLTQYVSLATVYPVNMSKLLPLTQYFKLATAYSDNN